MISDHKEMKKTKIYRNEKRKARLLIQNFADKTTIHGLTYLSTPTRYFWLTVIILSIAACSFFITLSFLNYFQYDLIANYNVINEIPMELPTITFCNMNSYKGRNNYTLDQMLLYCKYERTFCNSFYFVEHKISTYTCFSFNSGRDQFGSELELLRTSRLGNLYGIQLKLFAGSPHDYGLYSHSFLVFVHSKTDFPLVEQAITASAGYMTDILVIINVDVLCLL